VRSAENDGRPLFLKFKGAGRFRPRSLSVLEALLQLRKSLAKKKDKPLFKIFSSESLIKLTKAKPVTLRRLKGTQALSAKQIQMYGKEIVEVIRNALDIPEENLPVYPRKKTPPIDPAVPKRVAAFKAWRNSLAEELELDPALLLNKSLLGTLAKSNPRSLRDLSNIKEMKNWQRKAFGKKILGILDKIESGRSKGTGKRWKRR
jgi:ribonuclease D